MRDTGAGQAVNSSLLNPFSQADSTGEKCLRVDLARTANWLPTSETATAS